MSKYAMEQLKEKLCRELDTIAEARELSSTDLDRAYKMSSTIKNLCKIDMLMEGEGGYSGDGDWTARGSYSRDYDRGSSYQRDSMGRYSGRVYSTVYPRDGYYSGGTMAEHLDAMLRDARTDEERRMIEDMRRKMM